MRRPQLGASVLSCAIGAVMLCSSSADAQLVVGTTTPTTTNPAAIYYDVTTGATTTLWNSAANKKVNGIAADNANSRLYANDSARLNYWNYGTVGTTPTFIGGFYRTDGTTFTATGVDGLTMANGTLYASTSFASSVYKRGIYSVNTTPDSGGHVVLTPFWTVANNTTGSGGSTVLGDIDYNAADNKFYAVSSSEASAGGNVFSYGLYSIDAFGSGAVTKVADFPNGRTAIDGLTIGGGKFYLSEQDGPNSRIDIYPLDIASLTYGTTITIPLADTSSRASDLTWASPAAVPEPASAVLLAIGSIAILRRRRNAIAE